MSQFHNHISQGADVVPSYLHFIISLLFCDVKCKMWKLIPHPKKTRLAVAEAENTAERSVTASMRPECVLCLSRCRQPVLMVGVGVQCGYRECSTDEQCLQALRGRLCRMPWLRWHIYPVSNGIAIPSTRSPLALSA